MRERAALARIILGGEGWRMRLCDLKCTARLHGALRLPAAVVALQLHVVHVLRSNPVPDAKRFQIDILIICSCYENTVLFAQYATLIQITLQ